MNPSGLFVSVSEELVGLLQRHGSLPDEDRPREAVLWLGPAVPFLADLVAAGGSWEPLSDVVWEVTRQVHREAIVGRILREFPLAQVSKDTFPEVMYHAEGIFRVTLRDQRAIIWAGHRFHPDPRARESVVLILSADRDCALNLLRDVLAKRDQPILRLWGGAGSRASPAAVQETQIVLPNAVLDPLFGELDRFWELASQAQEQGIVARRGLLLVGPPGTGKTQLIRHLITRYPAVDAHLFIPARQYSRDDPFGEMLAHLRVAQQPAMVILEDIDRIEVSGAVTAGYLLNCLDGLLENELPTLWVATSNDPSRLDPNLLNRPGRFDRTIVFDLPDDELRERLLKLFLPDCLPAESLRTAARSAAGLTGAHIREACTAARLKSFESHECLEQALHEELSRVQDHQRQARGLAIALSNRQVGFHPG